MIMLSLQLTLMFKTVKLLLIKVIKGKCKVALNVKLPSFKGKLSVINPNYNSITSLILNTNHLSLKSIKRAMS